MSGVLGWIAPAAVWLAVTLGAHGILRRFQMLRGGWDDWATSFLVGFTLYTTLVFLGALAGVPLGPPLMAVCALLVLGAGSVAGGGRKPRADLPSPSPWTPAEAVAAAALGLYAVFALGSALYFPALAMDAHSYDGRAVYLLHDRSLDLAIYHWPEAPGPRSNITYPPLFSLGLATSYAFGGWQSKIVNLFFALAWPLVIYGALRRHLPRFPSLTWAFVLSLTPEVFAHVSYALLNLPAMTLCAAETAALARFLSTRQARWLFPAAVAAAGASGVRPDAIFQHVALGICAAVVFVAGERRRPSRRELAAMTGVVLAPLLTWGLWGMYLRTVIGLTAVSPFGGGDIFGLSVVLRATRILFAEWRLFGASIFVWLATFAFIPWWPRKNREAMFYVLAAGAVLLTLVVTFSLLSRSYGGGAEEILTTSYKRALFYLIPPAGLAAALCPPFSWLAARGRGLLHNEGVHPGRHAG